MYFCYTIIKKCLKEVEETLDKNKKILDRFAKELLAREELEYDEIIAIFKEYGLEETVAEGKTKDKTWDNKA